MRIEVQLPRAQRRRLLRVTRKSRCVLEFRRARIILLLHEGISATEVAHMVGCVRATVYRTVKLFEEAGILDKLEFGDGRARYEDADRDHHDHLIDMNSGEVIEFVDAEIEALQEKIADKLGYELRGHRLELYGVPKKPRPKG